MESKKPVRHAQGNPRVSIIVSIGKNRVIGHGNDLAWRIPDDLKRVKSLTMGHPLVMGRKTHESIGKPLPGRTNIVITRDTNYTAEGCVVVHSLEEALEKAREVEGQEIFIFGGAQIYEQALPVTDRLYLTVIDDEKPGDAYFPPYEHLFTKKLAEESGEHEGLKYKWVDLERE